MKTIGFLISHKNGEGRRALLPEHIGKIKNADKLYFETGYGEAVGVSDEEYAACGCHIVTREQALACDIITDVTLFFYRAKNFIHILKTTDINMTFNKKNLLSGL